MVFLSCAAPSYAGVLELKTVVIDAGHGGTDPGAVSQDKRTYEKTLTLDISKKLADKISAAYPDVKVLLTRPDDKFVALGDRAQIANKAGADLFMSIHVNSTKSSSPNGYSIHVLGESSNKDRDLFAYNMDVCKAENSVILLEDDYNTKYQGFDPSDSESFIFMQLMQNSHLEQSLEYAQILADQLASGPIKSNKGIWQNPFLVLWKTAMPAVLVELGFISNQNDLSVLRQDSKRDEIAGCLFDAFCIYKGRYDSSLNISRRDTLATAPVPSAKEQVKEPVKPAEEPVAEKVQPKETVVEEPDTVYGTQIMAGKNRLGTRDKAFLGYEPLIVEVNGIYKYVIGCSASEDEAKENFRTIRSKYPSAFMVKVENGVSSPLQPRTTQK